MPSPLVSDSFSVFCCALDVTERGSSTRREAERVVGSVANHSMADEIIDELLPHELDWKSVVVSYPKLSVSVVAAAGFWLGRTRGRAILAGLTGLAAETVNESINEFFGKDVV